MSIIFIGTPAFAVLPLRRLAAAGHQISAVITQPDRPAGRGRKTQPPPVKEAALELGLNVLQPPSLRDARAVEEVRALQPEAMAAVAYGQILRKEFLEIAPKGVLNVHPSLLPKYRGASPVPSAILAGDDVTGVTIMLMDAGMDSGPILARREHSIAPSDTARSLLEALSELGADLLAETLPRWLAGEIAAEPQDDSLATVTRLLRKEDGRIDWTQSASAIWRQVRAYDPWPGAYTELDGGLLHIWEAWPLEGESGASPGTVVAIDPKEMTDDRAAAGVFGIQAGAGLLIPLEVQREGRKRLSAADFLRGAPGLIGRRLA